jgi:predicted  nucleic acid-binding Zn-ribbon protein
MSVDLWSLPADKRRALVPEPWRSAEPVNTARIELEERIERTRDEIAGVSDEIDVLRRERGRLVRDLEEMERALKVIL